MSYLSRRQPFTDSIKPRLTDRINLLTPQDIQVSGWLGSRIASNGQARLAPMDTTPLLAGFKQRPGSHPWIGEHVGKYLDALSLEWARTGNAAVRTKLDETVAELVACVEPDGYLGTYTPDKRFGLFDGADWDVWSHKYCLIGLLQAHRWTGNPVALDACRKVGDLLYAKFATQPQKLLDAGTHVGMAATSVLEPVVLLYRRTGEQRYLMLAHAIVAAIESERGPRILSTLRTHGGVEKVANGKAYEMLSNMVGLCEYARTIGDTDIIRTIEEAATDVIANHTYITGSMSHGEHFHPHGQLPNGTNANVGETCVTTTWIQLCTQLLRLTGKPTYAAQIEKAAYNHLAAAQHPDGRTWCYYTSLDGTKPYTPGINCCVSSGPRAMALLPALFAVTDAKGGLVFTLPESCSITHRGNVWIQDVEWINNHGAAEVRFRWILKSGKAGKYSIGWRKPTWITSNGTSPIAQLPSTWKVGQSRTFAWTIGVKRQEGKDSNKTLAAFTFGPWVMAAVTGKKATDKPSTAVLTAKMPEQTGQKTFSLKTGKGAVSLQPFADCGAAGEDYTVWLRTNAPKQRRTGNVLLGGNESRSRPGNINGSIVDGEPKSIVVTHSGARAELDWYAVNTAEQVDIDKIVYTHGHCFYDGGWFIGAPMVEVQEAPGGPWKALGRLPGYPQTNADQQPPLTDGQEFTFRLQTPRSIVGVRISGTPAHGSNPKQNFSSCAELSAYAPERLQKK